MFFDGYVAALSSSLGYWLIDFGYLRMLDCFTVFGLEMVSQFWKF